MESLKVVGLCVLAAVLYGIAHDQVTARICVEYFTVGHPPVFGTASPTLLGLGWGVIASWWAGLIIGVPLAVAARAGRSRVPTPAAGLVRPVGWLLLGMAGFAAAAGMVAYELARHGGIVLVEPLASRVPVDRQAAFLADGGTHLASYAGGLVGGGAVRSHLATATPDGLSAVAQEVRRHLFRLTRRRANPTVLLSAQRPVPEGSDKEVQPCRSTTISEPLSPPWPCP